ncbi:cache domain-containing sensor histidine kinase [Bacillus sp. FSL K6-3431]|uniref:cache domain-containing sensor histidine kinase n=1 Tax=Bacillus sp. FSL K6-3431 TaxID=2921500 RepID=UPI0030F705A2
MENIANKIKARLSVLNIRAKLLIYIIIIIVVSIATLGFLGNKRYTASIDQETNAHTIQMMNQVENNIQQTIDQVSDIMYYFENNKSVFSFLNSPSPNQNIIKGVQKQSQIYEARHPSIAGMMLVNKWNIFVSNNMNRISRDPLTKEDWYQKAMREPDKIHLISNPIGRNITTENDYTSDQVLAIVKAITDSGSKEVIGVILIDLKLEVIQKVIESVSLGQTGFMYIIEDSGNIVYSPVNAIVYRINSQWFTEESNRIVKTIRGKNFQIITNSFKGLDWKIVSVIALDVSLNVTRELQMYTALIALVTLIFGLLASLFFTKSVTKPIANLRSLMSRVEEGELHLRFPSRSNDEIGQLGKSFNNMIQEIENLINLVYEEQQKKREAELRILQAQIKPHFLYNTLDTIQWMAHDHKAQDIVDIIGALTQLFRIGLSKGSETIKVSEELKHIRSYIYIQMIRYEEKLTYSIEMKGEVMNLTLPKLILQPLVENAIYHGIKTKKGRGEIQITVERTTEALFLFVKDDGIGITSDKINQLNQQFQSINAIGRDLGYGLSNVNERIKLSYGQEYGIRISNNQPEGITVIAKIPINDI